MAIKYQVRYCKNPSGTAGTDYASPQAVTERTYTANDIIKEIQDATHYTVADVSAVVQAMQTFIQKALLQGQRVVLGDSVSNLGSLQMHLKSRCFTQAAITTASFNPAEYIDGLKIYFRPSTELTKHLKLYGKAKRVSSSLMD